MKTIIDAIKDENLFRPFLGSSLETWQPWLTALRCLYGLPVTSQRGRDLIRQCTGRDPDKMPPGGFRTALWLTGRRAGKSRISAICGAFEAALAGHENEVAKGERATIPILSPSKSQSRVITDYMRAVFQTPLLRNEVESETKDGFVLKSGTRVELLAGDFRTIRSFTLGACLIDEIAFMGLDADSKIRSDTELIRAVQPGLATIASAKLICLTSPYARRGWCWDQYQRNYGNDAGDVLVWNAPSRVMNPTLPQSVVDAAIRSDLQAAKSEYLGEFRDDVAQFISRDLIDAVVKLGRRELMPQKLHQYFAFVDIASGVRGGDDAVLAIGHLEDRKVIVDRLMPFKPPFDPYRVCGLMADELARWDVTYVVGDNYAGAFTQQAFASCGMVYEKCPKDKSALYGELLPRLCSGEIVLLDNEVLLNQLSRLERRTRAGGRDRIDHPANGHDDLANAVAGLAFVTAESANVIEVGGWR